MKPFHERLKIAINVESVNAFAKRSGIPEGTLRTYLSGASLPGLDKLVAISDAAQVNIEWLTIGKGPIKPSAEEALEYDEHLFRAVIEILESYWLKEENKLSPSEKASMITDVYAVAFEMSLSNSNIEKVIKDYEKFDTVMSTAVERISDPVSGGMSRKIFEKQLKRIFKEAYSSKEDLEFFIDWLIGAYAIRKHMKEGTLKFPVKDKDGTIRLIDFKDLGTEKEPKNQKP